MTTIRLQIVEPVPDRPYRIEPGQTTTKLRFKGRMTGEASTGLFFRWYSSLYAEGATDQYSLHRAALMSADQIAEFELDMGSHVITFAATDQPGETQEELKAVRAGSVTGGTSGDESCIIHVGKANIINLASPQVAAQLTLIAEAPWDWPNPDYRRHDRLQYRWVLEPEGEPENRIRHEFVPAASDLYFEKPAQGPCRVVFKPAQPLAANGQYKLTLSVETPGPPVTTLAFQTIPLELTQ